MNKYKFSIILTTFNRKELLRQALISIEEQKYRNFEVMVINDAGESVREITDTFTSEFDLILINNESNKGPSASRNIGIRQATGEYITFLDDDDIYYPNHLEVLMNETAPNTKVLYTDAVRRVIRIRNGKQYEIESYVPYSIDYHPDKLLIGNITPINCLAIKRELLLDNCLFDESLQALVDWELLIRLSIRTSFKHIKVQTCEVRWLLDGNSITSTRHAEQAFAREKIYSSYAEQIKKIKNRDIIISEFNAIWMKDRMLEAKQVSIVVPVYNNLAYTKAFIASVKQTITLDYELIIVDDLSNDGTDSYLTGLAEVDRNVKIIVNEKKYGFPGSVNKGIKAASGMTILVANNDIIMNKGGIDRMFEVLNSDAEYGIVAPISNAVMGPQLDVDAQYNDLDEMMNYAADILKKHKNSMKIFPRVTFLCVLMRRELIDKIGGLDERFAPGNFEDDDFCLRAQIAGYKTVIAQDVFVHHFGSKSFKADGEAKYAERLAANHKIFIDKWGADPEDIWLRGRKPKDRKVLIPLIPDRINECLTRGQLLVDESDYFWAWKYYNEAVTLITGSPGRFSEAEIQKIKLLTEKIKSVIQK